MVRIRSGIVSITGNFRENNEDSALVDPGGRYFIVADGMGGQAAGEKASSLAVELIPKKLDAIDFDAAAPEAVVQAVERAVDYANGEIIALGQVDLSMSQMGTTVAFLLNAGGVFYCGGIGDSRVYRLSPAGLEQLTKDHSLTQALRDAGTISEDEARNHRYKNVLYRYLGTKDGAKGVDARQVRPESGDRFLICSDGVTDGLEPAVLGRLLGEAADPQAAAEAIVAAAQAGGSRDNITCLTVFVDA